MNEDILQEAINCLLAEGMDKEASAVSDLVAEIKRLQARGQAKDFGLSGLADEVSRLKEELVRWQKIAIDLKASAIRDANSGDFVDSRGNHMFQVVDIEKCREQAARELGLQVKQEAGYVDRLERLALSLCMQAGWDQEDFEAALEKIRKG